MVATLLIQPDYRVGLTSAHIDQLREFASELRSLARDTHGRER